MKSQYMRYETGVKTAELRPLSIKRSMNINKMSTLEIVIHLYKRHEILILQTAVAVIFTYAIVTKLG